MPEPLISRQINFSSENEQFSQFFSIDNEVRYTNYNIVHLVSKIKATVLESNPYLIFFKIGTFHHGKVNSFGKVD